MFARWRQENFFAYMMQHFDIDGLVEYGAQSLPGTLSIINPNRRALQQSIKAVRQSERMLRAETALVTLLQRRLKKPEEARALIRELFVSSADMGPDTRARTLTIRFHRMANPVHDRAISAMLEELTQQGFQHPENGQTMIYTLV